MEDKAVLALQLYEQAEQQREQGDHATAHSLYEQALALHEGMPVPRPEEMARCLHGLALALRDASEYDAAQRMAERALHLRQQALGATHPDSAASLHLLGEIRCDRGEMQAGIELVEQALALREETLGEAHPDSIEGSMLLALMLAHQGERARAQRMLLRARTLCETHLGEDHLVTARVLNGLGVLWASERPTHTEARAMYERSLAIYERIRGPEHQDTARSLNNLATVLLELGEVEAAQPLLERSLALHERLLGPGHLGTAFVLMNLGDVYRRQGNDQAARPLYERALIICEKTFGATHPQTLRSLRKVVEVLGDLHQQGDERAMTMAMPLYSCLMALEAAAGILPVSDQTMAGAYQDPARAAAELHRWVARLEAQRMQPEPSAAEKESLEKVRTLRQQAAAAYEQGDYQSAQSSLEQALALQEQRLGESHLDHVELLHELARAKKAAGQPSAVLPLLQRAVDIQVQELGPHHPTTLAALATLMGQQSYEYGPGAALPAQASLLNLLGEALGEASPLVQMARNTAQSILAMFGGGQVDDLPPLSRSERREQALEALPPERAALLAGIDEIDWHSLHHAYGAADDVPDLLRMLLSEDESVREDVWESLYSNVWHQGTVYQATAHVVPFLLRMLEAGAPPDPSEVLYFLANIAEGSSYLDVHARGEQEEQTWRDILAKQGKELEPEREQERTWVVAANRAVGEGIPLYLDLVESEEDEVREQAFFVLSTLHTRHSEIVPSLLALLEQEVGEEVQSQIVRTLRALMDDSPESQQFFADLMVQGETEEIRFLAALALTERARAQTPEGAVTRLLETLPLLAAAHHEGWEGEAPFPSLSEQDDVSNTIYALTRLGQARAAPALLRALPLLQTPEDALEAAGLLLDMLFNAGQVQGKSTAIRLEGKRQTIEYWEPKPQPPRAASSLTESERAVLRALLAHEPLWVHTHNLLALYGLPADRTALGTFIVG